MKQVIFELRFLLRNFRRPQRVAENIQKPEKIKFTEQQLTEMGQYRMQPKARNVIDIFKDKVKERKHEEYLKKQKEEMHNPDQDPLETLRTETPQPQMEKQSKGVKKQNLRTFKIYKHQDMIRNKRKEKLQKIKIQIKQNTLETQDAYLQRLAKVRLIEQYLPYEYMKRVQKIFHKYNQATLRDIAFNFSNLMRLRYNEQKIDYEDHPYLSFNKLEEKLPFHRKVEQIYLTSKEKIFDEKEEESKVDKDPIEPQIKYTQNIAVSYLLNRVPRTYAVAYRTINQIKQMFTRYSPQSFLDFGSGLSTGSAAFIEHFGDTGKVYSVQPAGKMRKLAKYLTDYSNIIQFQSLAELSSQVKQVDIVYCGYVLNEIRPELIPVYLEALYAKAKENGFLILVQYGNPFGARLIHESRKWALTKNMKIVAPCPHHGKCPLANSKQHWCHFDQPSGMFPREVFGKLPNENSIKLEKYSYLILQKLEKTEEGEEPELPPELQPNISYEWDRVLFPLMRKGKHFLFNLCTKSGLFEKRTTAKSHGVEYKFGRKLRWGDFWRFGKRIPNRYRKQRKTGKRLW